MKLIVHGGAESAAAEPTIRQQTLDHAVTTGLKTNKPVAAVESAINILEASPRFNAGVGGAVQADGVVRTDAGIMTSNLAVGSACSMTGVKQAVSVARAVLDHTPHICLSGAQATNFASAFGIETDESLLTEATQTRWEEADPPQSGLKDQLAWVKHNFSGMDTVGAVASDGESLAAATSTGGRWFALPGRVGDVTQVGCGFYCSPAGGVSATGAGEDIARITLSRTVVDYLQEGHSAQTAAERAISDFEQLTDSEAGVIVCGADGSLGSAYNTEAMQVSSGSTEVDY